MYSERSIPLGVDIRRLRLAWQPQFLDLEARAHEAPTHEILRRFHHLAQDSNVLIHSTQRNRR